MWPGPHEQTGQGLPIEYDINIHFMFLVINVSVPNVIHELSVALENLTTVWKPKKEAR